MTRVNFGARNGLRCCLLGLAAIGATLTISSDDADARRHHYYHAHAHYTHYVHASRTHHHARAEEYSPPYSSIVVDGNSGAVLQASNPDALRHPASLTKVMTLYLLFERLDAGKIKLDNQLKISEHAAEQDPTKLNLKPGQTISVEDAIKGIVTKSANDAAVVIAENLGGDEPTFAKLMTAKAHALGMSHTTYVNASGLPDDDQITSAHDQATLGRAIQERFPHYYKYFSTESFVYHGEAMRNHNHLLGAIEGVDGIKTGFTRASGFNLLTSVHRDGRFIVAVVMGGPSAGERDARMRALIGEHIKEAALKRTAPMIAESGERHDEPQPVAFAKTPMTTVHAEAAPIVARAETTAAASVVDAHVGSSDPIRPLLVKTISYRTAPVQTASLGPMPALVPVTAPAPQPAVVPAAPQPVAVVAPPVSTPQPIASATPAVAAPDQQRVAIASAALAVDLKAAAQQVAAPQNAAVAAPPAAVAPAPVRPIETARDEPAKIQPAQIEPENSDAASVEPSKPPALAVSVARVRAHGGWLIQIGAFDDEDQAKQHLSAAQVKVRITLAAKDPFTERVQKGDKALYRARFAGFDKSTAEAACKELKRSDFECMALKD